MAELDTLRALIVEDDPDDAELMRRALRRNGTAVESRRVDTPEAVVEALEDGLWDVVLADYTLPSFRGLEVLDLLDERGIDVPLIIVSGTIEVSTALEAMKRGARDFVLKDELGRLLPTVMREVQAAAVRRRSVESASFSEALNRVNHLVHSSLEFDEIMRRVVVAAAEAVGCDSTALHLREGDQWVIRYVHRFPEEAVGTALDDDQLPLAAIAARAREPVVIYDVATDPRADSRIERAYDVRSVLVVPLITRDEPIGALFFHYQHEPREFSAAQIDFAGKLSASVSLALENVRLIERARESARLSEALNIVNEVLLSTIDPGEMLEKVVVEASTTIGADRAILIEPDEDVWVIRHVYALPSDIRDRFYDGTEATGVRYAVESRQPVLIQDTAEDPRVDRLYCERNGIGSLVLMPLVTQDRVAAIIQFSFHRASVFGPRDFRFAQRLSTAMSLAFENARLFDSERRIAETLQQGLLALPEHMTGLELASEYHSAAEHARVGGDFYDVFEISPGVVGIAVGDVSGKGLNAAALTSLVKNTLRAFATETTEPPAVIMQRVNRILERETDAASFVTVFFGVLRCDEDKLTYCSAGHTAAVLLHVDGGLDVLPANSPIAGAFPTGDFTDTTATMAQGDSLLVYTDGVVEARQDSELFGEERLFSLLDGMADATASKICAAVLGSVLEFTGGTLDDDLALLAVQRVPSD